MATIDDIARQLGISKGTVSKALNGAPDVSETMRKSVLEAAVELGYSRTARNSTGKRLCIFIENMAWEKPDDFGWDIVTGFRKMAEPAGFSVDIISLSMQVQKATPYDEYMLFNDYMGAFFLGMTLFDPWMHDFETCRTPAVLYDNHAKSNPSVTYVGVDNDEGMELAVSRLKELGHQKIGYLSNALGSYVYQARYAAFFHAMRQNDLDAPRSIAGYDALCTAQCLERHFPRLMEMGCTAIICSNDLLAHAVMIHCSEIGIRIPDDLSIIGFDDIPLCRYTIPPLSTIRQNRTELGKSAFYALSSQLNSVPICKLLLHAELIQRDSIGEATKK